MKSLLFLLVAAAQLPAAITVSNVRVTDVSHGTALVWMDVSNSAPNGDGTLWSYARICYSTTAGNCAAGVSGTYTIFPFSYPSNGSSSSVRQQPTMRLILTGLAPSTKYEVCPELSNDRAAWTPANCASITTLGRPAIHPVLATQPIIAKRTDIPSVPTNFTGFHYGQSTGGAVVTDENYQVTTCANFRNDLNFAVDNQASFASLIVLQAGQAAKCGDLFWEEHNPPDTRGFSMANVNMSNSSITVGGHGLSEGHGVQFGANNTDLPGEYTDKPGACKGIKAAEVYYAHFPDPTGAPDTFQLTCSAPLAQGGKLMVFGSTSWANMSFAPYPRRKDQGGALYPIVIHPSTPESKLPPPGVRLNGPAYAGKLAVLQPEQRCGGAICLSPKYGYNLRNFAFTFGYMFDDGVRNQNANIWMIGMEIQSIDATGDPDFNPVPTFTLISFKDGTSDNGIDRSYIHGQYPFPSRLMQGMDWSGHLNTITNSYFDRLLYPTHDSGESTYQTEGNQFFQINEGPGPYVFYNNYLEGTGNTLFFQAAPHNGIEHQEFLDKKWLKDIYVARSTFTQNPLNAPQKYCFGNPGSDGWEYRNRQILEWKGGYNSLVDGNTFQYDCHWAASAAIAVTDVVAGLSDITLTNNTFRHLSSGVMMGSCTQGGLPACMQPTSRYTYKNNLFYDLDGFKYIDHQSSAYNSGHGFGWNGYAVQTVQDGEDMIWDHNTVVSIAGYAPAMWWLASGGAEGFQFTNSIFQANDDKNQTGDGARTEGGINGGIAYPNSPNNCMLDTETPVFAESLLSCQWRYPGGSVAGNLMTATAINSNDGPPMASRWPNQKLPCLAGNTSCDPTNLDFIKWTERSYSAKVQDYHLRNDSRYISGGEAHASDGLDMGADIDALEKAQGRVHFTSVIPGSTTASVNFVAPDAQGCPVDVSSSDSTLLTTFTRTADAGGAAGPRTVAVSGLAPKTDYFFKVQCAVEQPSGVFHTN